MAKVNPRVDIAFKKIFGVEENKDLLIELINSIVSAEDQVADITLLNPYNLKSYQDAKLSILDIKAQGLDGKRFNIEMQITDEANYDKRALYYWGKVYTEQLKESDTYAQLNKAIGIHILNFISIPETNKYHNAFHITEKDSGFVYFKDLELHTIELKKFTDNSNEWLVDGIAKIKNSIDMWSAFLTRHDLILPDELPQNLNKNSIKKALNVLEIMNFNSAERETYEGQLNWLRIEDSAIRKAKADAMELGKAEGKAEGLELGKAQGHEEQRNTMVKNLLKEGASIEMISKVSGLTIQQIEKLKLES